MRIVLMFILIVSQSTLSAGMEKEAVARKDNREWRAAKYRGLTIGKSTKTDMLRVLGKPNHVDIPEGQRKTDRRQELWYLYERGGELPGNLTVMVDKTHARIVGMDLSPENLPKAEAIRHFGDDYIETRYDFCKGFDTEDSAPIYETPNGSILNIEYRSRGIAFRVNYLGEVDTILYLSGSYGLASERECEKELREYQKVIRRRGK